MPHIHSHISSASNHDWFEFWKIWWWIWIFILNIFVDSIEISHGNRFIWCLIKRYDWSLVFSFHWIIIVSNGCSEFTMWWIHDDHNKLSELSMPYCQYSTVYIQWKALLFSFIDFHFVNKTLDGQSLHQYTQCSNKVQLRVK